MVEAKAAAGKLSVEAPRPTVDKRHRASPRPYHFVIVGVAA